MGVFFARRKDEALKRAIDKDNQKTLFRLAKDNSPYSKLRKEKAAAKLKDQKYLKKLVAIGDQGVSVIALGNITDQDYLMEIAKTHKNALIRRAAIFSITDPEKICAYVRGEMEKADIFSKEDDHVYNIYYVVESRAGTHPVLQEIIVKYTEPFLSGKFNNIRVKMLMELAVKKIKGNHISEEALQALTEIADKGSINNECR